MGRVEGARIILAGIEGEGTFAFYRSNHNIWNGEAANMVSRRASEKFKNEKMLLVAVVLILSFGTGTVWAQTTASITGTAKDTSGAVVPGTTVTAKNIESGATRTAETDANGSYSMLSLPLGQYEVTAEKTGFKQQVQRGITLVVAQQAVVNLTLEVGNVEQQVTVTAEASLVDTTLSQTSGLVGEQQVKDLPLNGRSFDLLMALNVGTVNYTSESRNGNVFDVAGRRQEENRYILNGVEFLGPSGGDTRNTPAGIAGQLLGVDGVREFNVVENTYGAEYGKRPGGQVNIVTSSGTNQLHGTAFEFLRNSDVDARNFFSAINPPFKRNQFGGALGGPIKKDKLFVFGNYEGIRQRLGLSDLAVVPDAFAHQGYLPNAAGVETLVPNLQPGMLPILNALFALPNGPNLGGGVGEFISNPAQPIEEEFGMTRVDYNASLKDSFSANYLIDRGNQVTPNAATPSISVPLLENSQVLGLQETHIFSPTTLNVATAGFSRAIDWDISVSQTPLPPGVAFVSGVAAPPTLVIGGGTGTAGAALTSAGGQAAYWSVVNAFSWADDLHVIRGVHSISAGVWVEKVQENLSSRNTGSSGQATFATMTNFLQDVGDAFQAIPTSEPQGYRSTEAAWYVQDQIKLKPNLTLGLGLRDEMTTGWNEAFGRCTATAFDVNGIIETDPIVGKSCLTQNNAAALWQPRVGLAWDPTGTGTWSLRAGFMIANTLMDSLGFRNVSNYPFGGRESSTAPLLSIIPVPFGTQPPPPCNAQLQAANQACTIYNPGTIAPDMYTPTVQQWSLTIERQITKDLMFQLGYVGSEGYHGQVSIDMNTIPPQVCAAPQGCASGGVNGNKATVPQGTMYIPVGARPNPYLTHTDSWYGEGNSSYEGLTASLIKRASHGLTFKANYTYSKTLDMNSGSVASTAANTPQDILNPYNLGLNKGLASYNVPQQFNASFTYELPFGRGQRWGGASSGFAEKLFGGWQWNGILTVQGGFPLTPQAGSNLSGNGDTTNPDVPSWNPAFSGPVVLGGTNNKSGLPVWTNPQAFVLPTAGTFGNVGRDTLQGPSLANFDTSLFKKLKLNERWNMEFRVEAFNVFNNVNFGKVSPTVFSGSNFSPSAGVITTAATPRQLQFGLKLIF